MSEEEIISKANWRIKIWEKHKNYGSVNEEDAEVIKGLLGLYNKQKEDKNKLINYIAIRENKTHEQVCKEFEV